MAFIFGFLLSMGIAYFAHQVRARRRARAARLRPAVAPAPGEEAAERRPRRPMAPWRWGRRCRAVPDTADRSWFRRCPRRPKPAVVATRLRAAPQPAVVPTPLRKNGEPAVVPVHLKLNGRSRRCRGPGTGDGSVAAALVPHRVRTSARRLSPAGHAGPGSAGASRWSRWSWSSPSRRRRPGSSCGRAWLRCRTTPTRSSSLPGPGDRDAATIALAKEHRAPLVIQSTLPADATSDTCLRPDTRAPRSSASPRSPPPRGARPATSESAAPRSTGAPSSSSRPRTTPGGRDCAWSAASRVRSTSRPPLFRSGTGFARSPTSGRPPSRQSSSRPIAE